MRSMLAVLLILSMLLMPFSGMAEGSALSIQAPGEVIRPAKAVLIRFSVPRDGEVSIYLESSSGERLSTVVEAYNVTAGEQEIWWNGSYAGVLAPSGDHLLVLRMGDESASVPVSVGAMAPYLTSISVENRQLSAGVPLQVSFYASTGGRVTVGLEHEGFWSEMDSEELPAAGRYSFEYDWSNLGLNDGDAMLTLQLSDAGGDTSATERQALTLSGMNPSAFSQMTSPGEGDGEEAGGQDAAGDDEVVLEPLSGTMVDYVDEYEPLLNADGTDASLIPLDPDQSKYTPSYGSPYTGQDTSLNYWTMPMDIRDEETVWQVLMQPITVLDTGKKAAERTQITIRSEPDASSPGVGVVTCVTQGVHVLESGEEWTKIECYSASFHDSKVKAWNMLVQGWVQTKYIKTTTPSATMGIVVDKLTQRLYIFRDGKLYDTLLCSTGLANAKQPYNETRSGEFLLTSAVGEFKSDNIYCSLAIRFNSGDLLHEVPHVKLNDGSKDYRNNEAKLGVKASHGCIRVQRKTTPKGTNMRWLWDNRARNIKILIWEDWQGRSIPAPDADTLLYYNPNGGNLYHSAETCNAAKGKTFTAFTYGELELPPYNRLQRCDFCAPPLRLAEIMAINQVYAPGGDHDPVMTEARKKLNLP